MAIKRKNYLIKKSMQLRWVRRVTTLIVLFALFIGYHVYIILWPPLSNFVPPERMDALINLVLWRIPIFSVPVLVVIIAFLVLFSHRIAGPLYRFEVALDQIINGEEANYIQLRKNDELKEFADKLNEIILYTKKIKHPDQEHETPHKNIH